MLTSHLIYVNLLRKDLKEREDASRMLSAFKAKTYSGGKAVPLVFYCEGGVFQDIQETCPPNAPVSEKFTNCFLFPGFIDVHVHLREPGFSYKETIRTGTLAAAAGGFTSVCAMPNLNPVPDCAENLKAELAAIKRDAVTDVFPYASITAGERGERLSCMEELAENCIAFSDDGRGVENEELMLQAMKKAKSLGKIIVAHCEEIMLVKGGVAHDGIFAEKYGLKGNPSESEWRQVQRDLELVRKTGCAYHVCHVSTKESTALIRRAKKEGLNVTCETAPHYLVLDDSMLKNEGRFKMNPPIRAYEDRMALLEGICDGTIDMIATDHAPHSAEEKAGDFTSAMNGVVGLETAFPVLYTELVKKGIIDIEKLTELMHGAPKRRFGIDSDIKKGERADFTVFDLSESYEIRPDEFLSMGRSTPFEGMRVYGKCLRTVINGRTAWQREK